jgi:hypothetical protein
MGTVTKKDKNTSGVNGSGERFIRLGCSADKDDALVVTLTGDCGFSFEVTGSKDPVFLQEDDIRKLVGWLSEGLGEAEERSEERSEEHGILGDPRWTEEDFEEGA